MNIKRHYITVITLFLTTLLVIFGLKDVLPRELYVGLSILMGMSLVISYSVLDIIGFFANKEWILEEEMWRFTPPTKQTVWGVWKLVTALMIMTIVFYLQDVKRDFFILPGFGAVSLGFFVFTYSFLVSVLTSMVSYPFGIYRFFSLISRNKGEAIGLQIKDIVLTNEFLERYGSFGTSNVVFVLLIFIIIKDYSGIPFFTNIKNAGGSSGLNASFVIFSCFLILITYLENLYRCSSYLLVSTGVEWLVADNPPLYLCNRFTNIKATSRFFSYLLGGFTLFSYGMIFYFLYVSIV